MNSVRALLATTPMACVAMLVTPVAFGGEWSLAGQWGIVHTVLIPKGREADRKFLVEAGRTICGSRKLCAVMFWTEKEFVPLQEPITDVESRRQVAQYNKNIDTGYERLLLHCRIIRKLTVASNEPGVDAV